jgi:hypothetical protein
VVVSFWTELSKMSGTEGDQMVETNVQETIEVKLEFESNENPAGKLFIGGLSWQTTEDGKFNSDVEGSRKDFILFDRVKILF